MEWGGGVWRERCSCTGVFASLTRVKLLGDAAHLFTVVSGHSWTTSLVRSSTRITDSLVIPSRRGTSLFLLFIFSCVKSNDFNPAGLLLLRRGGRSLAFAASHPWASVGWRRDTFRCAATRSPRQNVFTQSCSRNLCGHRRVRVLVMSHYWVTKWQSSILSDLFTTDCFAVVTRTYTPHTPHTHTRTNTQTSADAPWSRVRYK